MFCSYGVNYDTCDAATHAVAPAVAAYMPGGQGVGAEACAGQ